MTLRIIGNYFRLILIAERATVYDKFPTPLINRLEKHFVLTSSVLKDWQLEVLDNFKQWIKGFSHIRFFGLSVLHCDTLNCLAYRDHSGRGDFKEGHAFIGYQQDTPAAVVFQASKHLKKLRKGHVHQEFGPLREGGVPVEELATEQKGSDRWKEAVSRTLQICNFMLQ